MRLCCVALLQTNRHRHNSFNTLAQKVRLVNLEFALQIDLQAVKSVTSNFLCCRKTKRIQQVLEDQGAEYAEMQEQLQVRTCSLHVSCHMCHATVRPGCKLVFLLCI